MDAGQIALIVIVLLALFLLWGRGQAKKSGRLDAYNAMKAARNDAVVRVDGSRTPSALGAIESPEADAAEEAEAERDLQSMGIVARDQPDHAVSAAVSVDHQTWVGARRVGSNIQVRTETPADIRLAIKELRLLKREAQARKKELTLARSEENAEWRERQAGRYSTVGMGRGTGARIFRAGLQGKRRTERMGHADRINQIAAGQGAIDREILAIDGLIAQCEAALLRSE